MRPSDSYDNLHRALGFYKNIYTVRTTQEQILSNYLDNNKSSEILQFNYISQSYHSGLSCIKGQKHSPGGVLLQTVPRNFAKFTGKHRCRSLFVDKVAGLRPGTLLKRESGILQNTSVGCFWKGDLIFRQRERQRERERSKEYGCRQKQNYNILHQCNQAEKTILLMLRIIFTDTFLVYPADAVLRWWIFWIVSDSASSFFTAMWSSCSWIFWNFQKKFSKKAAWWSLGLLMLQRDVFRTELNNYDGASLRK